MVQNAGYPRLLPQMCMHEQVRTCTAEIENDEKSSPHIHLTMDLRVALSVRWLFCPGHCPFTDPAAF